MSTPYEREFFEAFTAGEVKALDFPGRCELTKISIVRVGTGAIVANIFNRKFVGAEHDILNIIEDEAGGKVRINLLPGAVDFNDVKVGDLVTVAGSSVGAYDTAHRVLVIDTSTEPRYIETDQTYSADATGGTAKLDIPTAEQPAYKVLPEITGTDDVLVNPTATSNVVMYVNKDPLPNINIGIKRKLYIRMDDAASYKIVIAALLGVAGDG